MPAQPFAPLPRPRYWNIWWLLTILSAAVGIIGLVLEGLGISLFATLLFGLMAATRNAVSTLHAELSQVQAGFSAEMSTLRMDLMASLGRIEDLLRQRLT